MPIYIITDFKIPPIAPIDISSQIMLTPCASSMSSHLGRLDALRWTPRMGEALHTINMNKSCPSDENFAFQVRLQLLKQRATFIREQQDTDPARTATASLAGSVPGLLYLKTLVAQLHEMRSSMSPGIHQKGKLV
jgi:hypothetical protein